MERSLRDSGQASGVGRAGPAAGRHAPAFPGALVHIARVFGLQENILLNACVTLLNLKDTVGQKPICCLGHESPTFAMTL